MSEAAFTSGKTHQTENFPVGSRLIAARHRPAVMAYYRFARAADDIADAIAPDDARLARLDALANGLRGAEGAPAVARELGAIMAARSLDPANAHDLLEAFRRDVTELRTASWDALMDYCRWSAMPVGRFMLDVHGEDPALRPASDALCAALQVINHLQDAREDYRDLGRVYLPGDALAAAGIGPEALAAAEPPAALVGVMRDLAGAVVPLLDTAAGFAGAIAAPGLAYEVAVIHALAVDLTDRLRREPFGAGRRHGRLVAAAIAIRACGAMALRRNKLRTGKAIQARG